VGGLIEERNETGKLYKTYMDMSLWDTGHGTWHMGCILLFLQALKVVLVFLGPLGKPA
jgi:hypothetical protein